MGNLGACHVDETLPEACNVRPGDIGYSSCTGNSTQDELVNLQLLRACEHGDIDAIIEALAAGGDIETRQHPLMAATNGLKEDDAENFPRALASQEVVEFKDGCIHAAPEQETVTYTASELSRTAATEPPLAPGLTPLMQAAKGGKAMAVALLLDAKALVHSRDELGMQPLHFAASIGCRESCQYLIGARACPRYLDEAKRNVFSCLPPRCIATAAERREWALLLQETLPGSELKKTEPKPKSRDGVVVL